MEKKHGIMIMLYDSWIQIYVEIVVRTSKTPPKRPITYLPEGLEVRKKMGLRILSIYYLCHILLSLE